MSERGQLILHDTKKTWLEAAKRARKEEQNAQADFEEQKDIGLTDLTFQQWAPSNVSATPSLCSVPGSSCPQAPAFIAALRGNEASEAQWQAAASQFDDNALREWQKERGRRQFDLEHGSGKDTYSGFAILTPWDDE